MCILFFITLVLDCKITRMMVPALLLTAAVASVQSIRLPQDVAEKYGAKCLNGQPPTFDVARNKSSNKWVLFLEGGGWCYGHDANQTKQSCAGRGGFVWPPKAKGFVEHKPSHRTTRGADIGGIMSQDKTLNPVMRSVVNNSNCSRG